MNISCSWHFLNCVTLRMAVNMAELCCPMSNCFRIVLIDRLSGIGHKHPVLPRTDCSFSRYLLITCGWSGFLNLLLLNIHTFGRDRINLEILKYSKKFRKKLKKNIFSAPRKINQRKKKNEQHVRWKICKVKELPCFPSAEKWKISCWVYFRNCWSCWAFFCNTDISVNIPVPADARQIGGVWDPPYANLIDWYQPGD